MTKDDPEIQSEKEMHEEDDVEVQAEIEEEAEGALADKVKDLRQKLKKAESERMEYLTGWQRAKADLINARKRDDAERTEFTKYANERLIDGLIPVLESFDMAMGNKDAWEKVEKNWRIGVEYIYSQLKKSLSEAGLQEIDPLGLTFDNALHEATAYEVVTNEKDDHKVLQVIQKGYALNGKVLKPARVKVGEYKK